MSGKKIVSPLEAEKIARDARLSERRLVFTNGCFDLLHRGHVECLIEAARLGDILLVAVNSDRAISKLKGAGRPLMCLEDRMIILSALSCVDYVIPFDDDDPAMIIEQIKPHVLVKGSDWPAENIVGRGFVEQCGGRVVTVMTSVPDYSTTKLIAKIRNINNDARR